jgi:hypothetical protein
VLSKNFHKQVKEKIKLIIHPKEQYENERFEEAIEISGKHLYLT